MKPPSPDRLIGWVLVAYYLGAIAVGLSGMEWPSQKLSIGLGIGAQVYSVGMVITGCIGVAANVVGSRRAEGVAIVTVGFLALIHGTVLFLAEPEPFGIQTGLRLIITLLPSTALAWYRVNTALTRHDIARQIAATSEVHK